MLALGLGLGRLWRVVVAAAAPPANFKISPANSNYRVLGGLQLQLWNDVTAGFHGFFPSGPLDAIATQWGDKDVTASDADADAADFNANADFRFISPLLELWNPAQAGFHAPWVDGPAGGEYLVWGVKDATADGAGAAFSSAPVGGNFRVNGAGLLQLAHATSGLFHTVWCTGVNGAVTETIGVGEP